jgi:DNA modification methylase
VTHFKILQGDCLEQLKNLPDASVQCCVTSPPYYGLRQYLFDKAVILRYDLTQEEKKYVESELKKHKVLPRK